MSLIIKNSHYGPKITTDGLVFALDAANIKSYPGSGDSYFDLSGLGNNATTFNTTAYDSANFGSFSFTANDDYISFTNPINSTLPYSIIQWVRPSTPLAVSGSSTFRKTPLVGLNSNWNPGYWLTATTYRVHADTEYRTLTIDLTGDTNWHQLGQVFDGTTVYAVLDGQLLLGSRAAYSQPEPTTILMGSENVAGNIYSWVGNIGHTSFYNRELTAQEVSQNFIALRRRYGI